MSRAREPRPWPKPVRWLAWLLAVMVVVALGMLTFKRPVLSGGNTAASPTPTVRATGSEGGKAASATGWKGLRAAGIPVTGTWSKQTGTGILLRQAGRGSPRSD